MRLPVSWVQSRKAERERDNLDQRTRRSGALGVARACSPGPGLGHARCWGKLSPLKMRSVALWGPHTRPGRDFCGPRKTRTPNCRLAGQGSAWECWVPWARCGGIILSGGNKKEGKQSYLGGCVLARWVWGGAGWHRATGPVGGPLPPPHALCILIHSMRGLASTGTAEVPSQALVFDLMVWGKCLII